MVPNNDDFRNIYNNLTSDDVDAWDVYAGEATRAAACEKGIPAEKWEQDRVRMQMGHEIMTEMLHEDLPKPASEEEKEHLCSLISGLIDTRLVCLSDDTARKGMLLQAIVAGKAAAGQEVDEEELAAMGLLDVNTLKAQLVDLNFSYTMNRVCPVIEQQCQLLMATPEQTEEVLRNPGALAIAAYLAAAGTKEDAAGETVSLQDMPEVAGAAAGLVEQVNKAKDNGLSSGDLLGYIAAGLLCLAAIIATLALLIFASEIIASIAIKFACGTTMITLGTAVAEAILAAMSGLSVLLKAALSTTVLSGVCALLSKVADWSQNNTNSAAGPVPSQHIVTV